MRTAEVDADSAPWVDLLAERAEDAGHSWIELADHRSCQFTQEKVPFKTHKAASIAAQA